MVNGLKTVIDNNTALNLSVMAFMHILLGMGVNMRHRQGNSMSKS
jgi:hypothetical protein